jgi:hypothetical protein
LLRRYMDIIDIDGYKWIKGFFSFYDNNYKMRGKFSIEYKIIEIRWI